MTNKAVLPGALHEKAGLWKTKHAGPHRRQQEEREKKCERDWLHQRSLRQEPTGAEQGHTVDSIIQELEPTQQQVTHT